VTVKKGTMTITILFVKNVFIDVKIVSSLQIARHAFQILLEKIHQSVYVKQVTMRNFIYRNQFVISVFLDVFLVKYSLNVNNVFLV
jgi:hypothetical protein